MLCSMNLKRSKARHRKGLTLRLKDVETMPWAHPLVVTSTSVLEGSG